MFHRFPELPCEIRLAIWRATWTPRVVRADVEQINGRSVTVGGSLPTSGWVNRESREETLRHYELCFSIYSSPTRVYFNFDLDTLEINTWSVVAVMYPEYDLFHLQRITFAAL
ncbi:hypothetical protein F4809DRAFT_589155 [Biscogniauxia mediterranea]|nr:hypothetical protein F4809DRAFT_589155 [Biscogniauxia mediterranea]